MPLKKAEMPERLEIGNEEHIKMVVDYELKHGCNRYDDKEDQELEEFEVEVEVPTLGVSRGGVTVEALDEGDAKRIVEEKYDTLDFDLEADDSDTEYEWRYMDIISVTKC